MIDILLSNILVNAEYKDECVKLLQALGEITCSKAKASGNGIGQDISRKELTRNFDKLIDFILHPKAPEAAAGKAMGCAKELMKGEGGDGRTELMFRWLLHKRNEAQEVVNKMQHGSINQVSERSEQALRKLRIHTRDESRKFATDGYTHC